MPRGRTPPASSLDVARRHVSEAQDRVLRQEEIVLEMERAGQTEAARVGRDLLDMMRSALDLARRHLERLEIDQRQ